MQSTPATGIYGAIEAGGTKFVCAVADETGTILAEQRLPTRDPESTLASVCGFFHAQFARLGAPRSLGVGSFGPVHLDKSSVRYGRIGNTPKAGWSGADIVGRLSREFACPIGFDTDVNAAALAEHRWGAARDVENLAYVTVGTGIGGGIIVRGAPLHGLMHPEIGHVYPRRHPLDLQFKGVCPFHGDCLEGLASGPAIVSRCGAELHTLPATSPQWDIEADYLAQLCAHLVVTVSPQRIVVGGGVMSQLQLLPPLRERLLHWLGGYIDRPEILSGVEHYVVAAALGHRAGVLGALVLALEAAPSA
jgi:fructokinase